MRHQLLCTRSLYEAMEGGRERSLEKADLESTFWMNVRDPAGASFEMMDSGITLLSWSNFERFEDGKLFDTCDTCPEDVKKD